VANWIARNPDASGYHRFRQSDDPPLAEQHLWIRLGADTPAALTGEADPAKWTVVGDTVTVKAEPALVPMERAKRLAEIDGNTTALIAAGFAWNGSTLSLSERAQARLETLYQRALNEPQQLPANLRWPLADNSGSVAVWTNGVDAVAGRSLYRAAMDRRDGVIADGLTLKDAINAATTLAELAAVVDGRT